MCFYVFICRARPSFTASLLSLLFRWNQLALSLVLFADFLSKLYFQRSGMNQISKLFVERKTHLKTWC